jgi:hypothetical protein
MEAVTSIEQRVFQARPPLLPVRRAFSAQTALGLVIAARQQDRLAGGGGHYPQVCPNWSTLPCGIIPPGHGSESPDEKLLVHGFTPPKDLDHHPDLAPRRGPIRAD